MTKRCHSEEPQATWESLLNCHSEEQRCCDAGVSLLGMQCYAKEFVDLK